MREFRNIKGLHPSDLTGRQRLLLGYAAGIVAVILVFTYGYYLGIHRLEGRDYSIFRAFQTVVETMTTTGYGADSAWETPVMNLYMVTMQFSGILIGLATLRVLVIPLFERTPLNLDDRLTPKDDHVVVAEYKRDTEVLLDELEALDVEYVLLETDRELAKELSDDGYQVIHGDPEDRSDLGRATIERASVLITDTGDRTASVVLAGLEANEALRVVSFTESARRTAALAEVGVDRSVAPHALIGRRLAEKATTPVTIESDDAADERSDGEVGIREILIRRDSPLHGLRVADSPLASHPELTLVAGWFDGELRLPPSPDDRLTPNCVLVIAGPEGSLDEVTGELSGVHSPRQTVHSHVIVAGHGEGGTAAVDALPDDVAATTIDDDEVSDPDIVGDVTEPATLEAAGIEEATALVVTVDDDATALMTVAMARSLSDDLEILTRVTDADKASSAFRAGADYVLSVQRAAARLVAAEVHGERTMDPARQIRLVRADAPSLAGETLDDARRDPERRWSVVGLSRDGQVHFEGSTAIEADDDLIIAGSDEAIQEFDRTVETD